MGYAAEGIAVEDVVDELVQALAELGIIPDLSPPIS